MNLENIKEFFLKLTKQDFSQKQKIFITASLGWIIFVGYLTWWNGLKAPTLDKSFRFIVVIIIYLEIVMLIYIIKLSMYDEEQMIF